MATATDRRPGTGNPKVEARVPPDIADAFSAMAKEGLAAREVVELVGRAWIDRPEGQSGGGFRERLQSLGQPSVASPEELGLIEGAPSAEMEASRWSDRVRDAASQGITVGVSTACWVFNEMDEAQVTYLARKWMRAHRDYMRELIMGNRAYRRTLSAITGRLCGEAFMGSVYARQLARGVPVDDYAEDYRDRG